MGVKFYTDCGILICFSFKNPLKTLDLLTQILNFIWILGPSSLVLNGMFQKKFLPSLFVSYYLRLDFQFVGNPGRHVCEMFLFKKNNSALFLCIPKIPFPSQQKVY